MKKLIASFLIGASLLSLGVDARAETLSAKPIEIENGIIENDFLIVYNRRSNRKLTTNVSGYEVINPNRDSFSTERKVALINGKAPAKTPINIKLYGTTDLTRNNFNLNKLPNQNQYIQISDTRVQTGNLGFFQNQLSLVKGINKIVIDFNTPGVKPIEIIVYVYETAPSVTEIISVVS